MSKFKKGDRVIVTWRRVIEYGTISKQDEYNDDYYQVHYKIPGDTGITNYLHNVKDIRLDLQYYREKRLNKLLNGI